MKEIEELITNAEEAFNMAYNLQNEEYFASQPEVLQELKLKAKIIYLEMILKQALTHWTKEEMIERMKKDITDNSNPNVHPIFQQILKSINHVSK